MSTLKKISNKLYEYKKKANIKIATNKIIKTIFEYGSDIQKKPKYKTRHLLEPLFTKKKKTI